MKRPYRRDPLLPAGYRLVSFPRQPRLEMEVEPKSRLVVMGKLVFWALVGLGAAGVAWACGVAS